MRKFILIMVVTLILPTLRLTAEDVIQIKPFVTYPGVTEDDALCMEVQMVNDTYEYVGNLQFDLLLPEGISFLYEDFDQERVPYTKKGRNISFDFTLFEPTYQKSSGYTRYLLIPGGKILPITGQSGTFMYLYYSTDTSMKPGVYPILVQKTVLSKTEIIDMHPGPSGSYVVVKASADAPNPLETEEDIDLSGMTNYIPTFVVDSLNTALARNANLRSLNLAGATSFGHELQVPENVVYQTDSLGGLKRTFTSGVKTTICLPFAVTKEMADSLGKFYEFGGLKEGTTNVVLMKKVDGALSANTPYIFQPSTDMTEFGFSGDTTTVVGTPESVGTDYVYTGIYSYDTLEDADNEYTLTVKEEIVDGKTVARSQFVKAKAGDKVVPFQACLKYCGTDATTLPETFEVEYDDEEPSPTSISAISNNTQTVNANGWYTIDGKKLKGKPSSKGVFIHNGKKTTGIKR